MIKPWVGGCNGSSSRGVRGAASEILCFVFTRSRWIWANPSGSAVRRASVLGFWEGLIVWKSCFWKASLEGSWWSPKGGSGTTVNRLDLLITEAPDATLRSLKRGKRSYCHIAIWLWVKKGYPKKPSW